MYSLCVEAIVSFDTSNISQTKQTEVNVRLVQAGLVTGNGLRGLRKF